MINFITRFFPSKKKTLEGDYIEQQAITLTPVYRKRAMVETSRKTYATELLDTYYGFGSTYLAGYIKQSITNANIQREMLKIVRCLPLLKFFINSISRVYSTQPSRRFYLDGKEIIKTPKESMDDENAANKAAPEGGDTNKAAAMPKNPEMDDSMDQNMQAGQEEKKPFNPLLNEDKFIYDDELYETLNNLYNDEIITTIKQAERFTNLLNTTVYKVVTDELGCVRMIFLPNDTVQIKPDNANLANAEQIAFIKDVQNYVNNQAVLIPIVENWTKDSKAIVTNPTQAPEGDNDDKDNQAAAEYEKLFGTKKCGSGFAPFVVFRDTGSAMDFWDLKDNDIVSYIKTINMELTELRYLTKFASFGLKYTVNIKHPENGVLDPNGFMDLAVANNSVPGADNGKNFEVGEFKNEGRIDEVIKAIIFNVKMLFSLYNIPLDALISTNSVRSAENKQMDNDELFAVINAQRDIWNKNEQNLFKVLQAVHNRDNDYKIPKGVEMLVNFEEKAGTEKVVDDWLVEIQNNISTALDWLADKNPDLDRDELMELLKSNKEINDNQKEEPLNLNAFTQVDEKGNVIMPKMPKPDPNSDQQGQPPMPNNPPMKK